MSGIKQIFNKEMARIFKDKKMVFSVFLLPVLIMVVILSIVNGLASNMKDDIESHVAQVYIVNEPEALNDILDASKAKFKLKSIDGAKEMKQAKKEILDGEADLIVEFPDNFQQEIENYQEGSQIPQVKTYQNPSEDYSRTAADNMDAALEVEPPQATSMLAAMLAARIAETCFFIGRSPFLPFGLCGASSFCVPRDASILENFFHFVQR